MFELRFEYNKIGFGPLSLFENSRIVDCWACRTGSIDKYGVLINAIQTGSWTGRELPAETVEVSMVVDGVGWKFRLWSPSGEWTHYLIHPDGNKPGSMGCIVPIKGSAINLRNHLSKAIQKQKILPVIINNW
jgi:hypothetical protein